MSSLGYQTVYHLLNSYPDVISERCFLPDKEDILEYIRTNTPLFSYETKTPLGEFDIIFFSISYELDFLNLPRILKLAKIPFYSCDRDKKFPLICCGGVTTLINTEPISLFVDFFVIGEAEEIISEIIEVYKENFSARKEKILQKLEKISGIYVPSLYKVFYSPNGSIEKITPEKKIKRCLTKNLNNYRTYSIISTPSTEFKNCFLVEVSRGCKRYCNFCIIPSCYYSYRAREVNFLLSTIKDNIKNYNSVGLIGASLSDYPYLNKLLLELTKENIRVQFSSLGVDFVEKVEMDLLKKAKIDNLTFALEVGSSRLRKIINKKVNISAFIGFLKSADFLKQIKFYFLIGLPEEDDRDILQLIDLVKNLREENSKIKMVLSVSIFVPKPNTPFCFAKMENIKSLKEKINFIQNSLKKYQLILNFESPKMAYLEGILSQGTRKLSDLLLEENLSLKKLLDESYLEKDKSEDEIFPWDIIDISVSKKGLYYKYKKALQK